MSEIEVHRRYCNRFGKTHTGLSNKQNKPIHIQTAVQVQACKQLLKLITAEILLLFIVGRLALDDNLASGITGDQAVINCIKDTGGWMKNTARCSPRKKTAFYAGIILC